MERRPGGCRLGQGSWKSLNLWFIPREGGGTLDRADQPYKLKNVTLREKFHKDLQVQLAAMALGAVKLLRELETERGPKDTRG